MEIVSIITKAREILRDKSTSPHYDDNIIKRGIESAIRHLCSMRPEVRYDKECRLHDVDDVVNSLMIDEKHVDGIAYYAASRCYDSDSVDTVNLQLAQSCLQRAIQEFQK